MILALRRNKGCNMLGISQPLLTLIVFFKRLRIKKQLQKNYDNTFLFYQI